MSDQMPPRNQPAPPVINPRKTAVTNIIAALPKFPLRSWLRPGIMTVITLDMYLARRFYTTGVIICQLSSRRPFL